MQLIGSHTSPYVRRFRMLVPNETLEFVNIDIFSPEGAKILAENSPARKVPILVDGQQRVFESRVIYQYLTEKTALPPLSWDQHNLLTLIDAANDSLVEVLLSQRSGFDTQEDKLFFNLQRNRLSAIWPVLASYVEAGDFANWDYLSISLFCLIDWVTFRSLDDLSAYQPLQAFYQWALEQPLVKETDPR